MIGTATKVRGYVTQDKYLAGRTLGEIAQYLGFHPGRLAAGARFVKLDRLPLPGEFELAAYSMTPAHRYATPQDLDVSKLKSLAMSAWSLSGPNRLVKVVPATEHDRNLSPDEQYPPGSGVPQWRLTDLLPGTVVAEVRNLKDRYRPAR